MSEDILNIKAELERQAAVEELKSLETSEDKKDTTTDAKISEVKTESTETTKTERTYTDIELEQMEKGWDPNYEGSNKVSAEEFKRVGEIIDAKRAATKKADLASREVEELTKTVKSLVEQNRAVEKATREKVLKELEVQKYKAIEEGDVAAFKLAEAEHAKVVFESQKQIEQPVSAPVSEEVRVFQEENKEWLTGTSPTDVAMQAYVKARVKEYMDTNPNVDEKLAISSIKDGLTENFPTRFSNPNKNKPALTMTSTTSTRGDNGNYSVSRLDMNQRMELAAIQKADPSYTVAEYVKQLELVGRLAK